MIRNKQLRKIEARRLYLMRYADNEIMQRTGCSIIELDRWRSREGWEDEKKVLDDKCRDNDRSIRQLIDSLLTDCSNPHSLSLAIRAMSRFDIEDIFPYASKIIKELKT